MVAATDSDSGLSEHVRECNNTPYFRLEAVGAAHVSNISEKSRRHPSSSEVGRRACEILRRYNTEKTAPTASVRTGYAIITLPYVLRESEIAIEGRCHQ